MLTKIPFFREARTSAAALPPPLLIPSPQVIVMAFECPHCGFRSSEVQMGGQIPDKGVRFTLAVAPGDSKASPPPAAPPAAMTPRRSRCRARW